MSWRLKSHNMQINTMLTLIKIDKVFTVTFDNSYYLCLFSLIKVFATGNDLSDMEIYVALTCKNSNFKNFW